MIRQPMERPTLRALTMMVPHAFGGTTIILLLPVSLASIIFFEYGFVAREI